MYASGHSSDRNRTDGGGGRFRGIVLPNAYLRVMSGKGGAGKASNEIGKGTHVDSKAKAAFLQFDPDSLMQTTARRERRYQNDRRAGFSFLGDDIPPAGGQHLITHTAAKR